MFWIVWCYFGLTLVHLSDAQRRAVVNYSYTTSKPLSSPATTALPSRSTTTATEETSINAISKLPTTDSLLRGASRGESQVKSDKKKQAAIISSLAKGDFADRQRAMHNTNATTHPRKDVSDSAVPSPRGPTRNKEEPRPGSESKASILTASSIESYEEGGVYPRRVPPAVSENRPEEDRKTSDDRNTRRNPPDARTASRPDISPTKVYDTDIKSSRADEPIDRPPRDDVKTPIRDYVDRNKPEQSPKRDDIQSSRRSEPETDYRQPNFDREYPRRQASGSDRDRHRYDDDFEGERGSRGRYEKRDRGRDSDDRYPKGDTRVYPDERAPARNPPIGEDGYRARERYPEDSPRRGDDDDRYDDRYSDYNDRPRSRDRPPPRDDRYRDEDRYRSSGEDKYRDRDGDRYRPRDDDRYRSRDDDRYKSRDDDRIRQRDDERYAYRDDERYKAGGDDDSFRTRDEDRYRTRDDDRYRPRDEDRYRTRDEDRYRTRDEDRYRGDPDDRKIIPPSSRDENDEYRPRGVVDDAKYIDYPTSRARDTDFKESASRSSSSLPADRKPTSSRSEYVAKETVTDYDNPARDRSRSYVRDDASPSRISRPPYDDEDRYRDRGDDGYRRPSRYEDDVRSISPTRTREDSLYSRSTLIDSRSRDVSGSRYVDSERDRIRDDRYYDQDSRVRSTRIQDSRSAVSASEHTGRYPEDVDRYRTRLPSERTEGSKIGDRKEEVVLDHRSYISEEDEEARRRGSKKDEIYEDRGRNPSDETRRRYRDDERYPLRDRNGEEQYNRRRDDYDRPRSRSRDRYDEEYRKYDDRYSSRGDPSPPLPLRKYDAYPDEDERYRRRDSEISTTRKEDSRDRESFRPSSSLRDEERYYGRDEYPDSKSSPRGRYDDDLSPSDSREERPRDPRPPVIVKQHSLASSRDSVNTREPTDIVIREKRFHSSSIKHESSRVYGVDASNDRSYTAKESKPLEQLPPLSAKDVIEAAIRHSDDSNQNARKVYYPVFDPRVSNLTSPEIIRPSERRGTTITAKKKRSV